MTTGIGSSGHRGCRLSGERYANGGSDEAGVLDAGPTLAAGTYTLGADGGLVLADPLGQWPGVADETSAYYPTSQGISSLAFGSTVPAIVTTLPGAAVTIGVGANHRVYYTLSTQQSCIYRTPGAAATR
jgi:hypothetical protein